MILRAWVSDIELILQKSKISKDSRIYRPHLADLVNKYRAIAIAQKYQKSLDISPTWLQNLGTCDFTIINSAEDPLIKCTTMQLGKFTLPGLVDLDDDAALGSVFRLSKRKEWFRIDYNKFFSIPEGSDQSRFDYCFRIGDAIYVNNPEEQGNIICILDNPLEGFILLSENVTSLVKGTDYQVISGNITSNGVTYFSGNTFTATATTFTGTGKVQFKNQKRKMTWDDTYPMSRTMGEFVCMKIFTNEFSLEPKEIADIKNDSQDELALLQPGEQDDGR